MYHQNILYEKKTKPIDIRFVTQLTRIPHMHKEIEIVFFAEGVGMAFADDNSCTFKSGDLFISFPNQIHYYDVNKEGSFYVLILSPEIFLGQEKMLKSNIPLENVLHFEEDTTVRQLLMEAKQISVDMQNNFHLTALNGYVNLLMYHILKKLAVTPFYSTDTSSLRTITDYCYHHFREELSLETLSSELHFNKYYISHLINKRLNMRFNDYVNVLRVDAACTLLSNTDNKIADISEDVGFGTIRSFNRAFQRQKQMTPLEFRAQQRNKCL